MAIVASSSVGFATSPTNFSFGTAPTINDYDVLGINSDTTIGTPTGFTRLDFAVNNQGSYLFYRKAVGGESSSVSIVPTTDLKNATLVWARVRGATSIDKNIKAVAFGTSSASSPSATTAALTNTGELALAFSGIHKFTAGVPTTPVWNNGYTSQEFITQGTATTGCAAFLGFKTPVGTAAETASVSWTNGAFDRDTYIVTFVMDTAVTQTVSPTGVPSGEALGVPALVYNQNVSPTGIPTGEAFGIPFINNGNRTSMDVQGELNRIAKTSGKGEAGAANIIAGTTGKDTVGALNIYVGNPIAKYKDFQGVANQMAGTTGLGTAKALSLVNPIP